MGDGAEGCAWTGRVGERQAGSLALSQEVSVPSCGTFPRKSVCEQRATSGAAEGARPARGLPVPWAPTLSTHEGAAPNAQALSEPPYLWL